MLRAVSDGAVETDDFSPVLPGPGGSDYERYLQTDALLALQRTPAEWAHRDELLFMTVHQSSELWLKLAVAEVEEATRLLDAGELDAAIRLLRRANDCMKIVHGNLDMLEHMSPWEYTRWIRPVLGHGSGFDSPGFNGIRRVSPPLAEAFHQLRRAEDLSVVDVYTRGREFERLYQLAELLTEWDERVSRLALPPLQGRRADHRRRGRRDAGHPGRAARPADPQQDVPGAVAGAQRADVAGQPRAGVSCEELKARLATVWGAGDWRLLADWLAPMHEHLVASLAPQPGERWLDAATGTGANRAARRPCRCGRHRPGSRRGHDRAGARGGRESEGLDIRFDVGDVEQLPYEDSAFDVVASAVGAILTPNHRATAAELARVCRPGGRLGLTAWRPGVGYFEVMRRFYPPPEPEIDDRENWGREEYVSELLGEDFELRFEAGENPFVGPSGEELWSRQLAGVGAGAGALSTRSSRIGGVRCTTTIVEYFEQHRVGGGIHAPARVPADPGAAPVSLRDEVVELLRQLIRLDTVNPPGNETPAAELLRDYLEPHGVDCSLYARAPHRANLVARIPGRAGGPRLLLLSHTDTVLADPSEWQVDPWSGELRDGCVWGRGALDMKGHVAAAAVAVASLAREGFVPGGDLIFAACADEEVGEGDQFGLAWLCEHHPDAVEAEYAVNEGGGSAVRGRRASALPVRDRGEAVRRRCC